MVATLGRTGGVAEGAIVAGGIRSVMMDGAGGVSRGVMADQAAISVLGAQGGVAIGASPTSAAALRIDVAESAIVVVDGSDSIRASVATVTFRIVHEVGRRVAAMGSGAIGMAIQATDSQEVILDNGLDAAIAGLDIERAGRVMARDAGVVMEGIDTGCAAPGVGELL